MWHKYYCSHCCFYRHWIGAYYGGKTGGRSSLFNCRSKICKGQIWVITKRLRYRICWSGMDLIAELLDQAGIGRGCAKRRH